VGRIGDREFVRAAGQVRPTGPERLLLRQALHAERNLAVLADRHGTRLDSKLSTDEAIHTVPP
jgi:hypothetical protein